MKKIQLRYNPQTRYKNGRPRFGSERWCRQVVANENLTSSDYLRFADELLRTGNTKGLEMMQQLLKQKLNR